MNKPDFHTLLTHCDFDYLPDGLERKYEQYKPDDRAWLIPRDFLGGLYDRYRLPERTRRLLTEGIEAIESDPSLFAFTKFLADDMCTARIRCDEAFYTNMTPGCLKPYAEKYSFLLLLACVVPSMDSLKRRGVPESYYSEIPHQFLKVQFEKLGREDDFKVHDFPWVMNFYTCSIFLLDRFYFIPHRFHDELSMYRSRFSGKTIALYHAGGSFRRDGQLDGVNGVRDAEGAFVTEWKEDADRILANRINPMGFVEREPVSVEKSEWDAALRQGDMLLALHIPSGPGYTPDRLKSSMTLAVDFYRTYYPELRIRGFWSESWLYDPRLSLILGEAGSNIVSVQRQFYNYPIAAGDAMLRYEAFGDRNADPSAISPKTSLQKAAAAYMKSGGRFHTTSMVVLKEDIDRIGTMTYITPEDAASFRESVDSHLAGRPVQ
ncbi:acyltransferase domain-containing protein [Paenibacillus arenilitoris]|uniref:Uncharacterized protein n=1 Tax=Paenibacillus arenilitoris TaxID=2772299 RepID=A0A927CGE5_9BACL|nr:acyltransferase domain-containing protein [Paenibacillus arenilitoris]MBD2867075.1 hypothetical protein [Paenibacillus arenilitoris]